MNTSLQKKTRFCAELMLISLLAVLAGCASLPTAGPTASDIQSEASADQRLPSFKLVEISHETMEYANVSKTTKLASTFTGTSQAPILAVGAGDGITITLWETGADPLFSNSSALSAGTASNGSARSTTLPEAIVGTDGKITVPFVGRIKVVGLTPIEIQSEIEKAFTGIAQRPQAAIAITRNISNTVTLFGEAAAATRVALSPYGERILDVLASSGGVRSPPYETNIKLTRNGVSASIFLEDLLENDLDNIPLLPKDQIVISRQPKSFTVFGATGRNMQIGFEERKVTLIEAIAKAGGLLDSRADPKGIFLLRYEQRQPENLTDHKATSVSRSAPVVYRLDLTKIGGYFLAQNFEVRNQDILYVSNAPATELEKFLNLVGLLSQPIISGVVIHSTAK